VIPLTWVIFAIPTMRETGSYFARLFPFFGVGEAVNTGDFWKEFQVFWPVLLAAGVFCIPAVYKWFGHHRKSRILTAALFILFWVCVYQISNAANNPFMYANF
ncbi:MAG: MBOAT family protein, partial [Eisenbergiella sp.]